MKQIASSCRATAVRIAQQTKPYTMLFTAPLSLARTCHRRKTNKCPLMPPAADIETHPRHKPAQQCAPQPMSFGAHTPATFASHTKSHSGNPSR
eukprot:3494007-Pleurochrysis_carterae.AAC.1